MLSKDLIDILVKHSLKIPSIHIIHSIFDTGKASLIVVQMWSHRAKLLVIIRLVEMVEKSAEFAGDLLVAFHLEKLLVWLKCILAVGFR